MRKKLILFLTSLIVTSTALYFVWIDLFPRHEMLVGTKRTPKAKLYGWALEPNRSYVNPNFDTGRPISFASNSAGWRDVPHQIEKRHGMFRILVIGDSVTMGSVFLQSLYTRQLERLLKETGMNSEVITMAAGGWSTDQELEALRLEGLSYSPDMVVIQYCGNDIFGNQAPYSGLDSKDLLWEKPFRYELTPTGKLKRVQPMAPNQKEPTLEFGIPLTQALFREMKRISIQAGADFLIFTEFPYPYMKQLCDGTPVDCYIPTRPYTRYKNDPHYNTVGNTEMALDLAKYFLNRYHPELNGRLSVLSENPK
jgi:hypothetical protein